MFLQQGGKKQEIPKAFSLTRSGKVRMEIGGVSFCVDQGCETFFQQDRHGVMLRHPKFLMAFPSMSWGFGFGLPSCWRVLQLGAHQHKASKDIERPSPSLSRCAVAFFARMVLTPDLDSILKDCPEQMPREEDLCIDFVGLGQKKTCEEKHLATAAWGFAWRAQNGQRGQTAGAQGEEGLIIL